MKKLISPKIKLFFLLLVTLGMFLHIINGTLQVNDMATINPVVKNGVIDMRGWDFSKNGIIKLDGEWEFYKDQLLTPKDFNNTSLNKSYSPIPGTLGGFGYGTYRLKVLVDSDDYMYSVKIDYVQNAYKLWGNNREIVSVGKVGRNKNDILPQNLPKTGSFYTENGEVYLILQVSNFYSKFGFIDSILMGEASTITSLKEKKLAFDLFLFGSSIIAAIYNIAVFFKRRKDKAPLYFAIVCIIVALRTLFLGERFLIALFPEFNFILAGKIMMWTFYLYIPFIVLFIHKTYDDLLNRTVVKISNFSALLYLFTILISPTAYYLNIIVYFEIFALLMILFMILKISKVYIKAETNDYVAIVGLFALFITRINDILYEFSIIITSSFAPLGVFIFIIANYYILAERQAKAFSHSEDMSEKLKSLNNLKDDFLAITSHELQTPLNGIIGLTEELTTNSSKNMDDNSRYNLSLIKSSAERLSSLVNDIIVFSKLKNKEIKLQKKQVKIDKLVEMVIKFSEPTMRNKAINLVNLIDSNVPNICADENRVQQIFYNLLGNGIKFTHEGTIVISYEAKDKFLEISIEDSGIGIPEERLHTIFDLYEQGEGISEKYGGTGLGLYITKNLVELHGGNITVNSIVNKGTNFTFTLPLCSVEDVSTCDCNKTVESQKSTIPTNLITEITKKVNKDITIKTNKNKNYKILIVDDEYVNQRVLENYLSHFSENILKASSGREALEIIEKNPDLDLVILDMMLPDMMGHEISTTIRKKYSLFQLPILMMTANNRQESLVTAFECGVNDYLRKPFSRLELLSRVNTLLTLKTLCSKGITFSSTGYPGK